MGSPLKVSNLPLILHFQCPDFCFIFLMLFPYRNLTSYSYPEVYHNSFWSNYYTNYWQPASSYYNSFSLPPSYPLPRYQFDELPGDDFSVSHPTRPISKTRKNVRERSRHFLSKMVAKRFPFVNGNIVIFN